jgi:hypothetical protein
MRAIPLLVTAAALAACTTQPPGPYRTAERQAEFQKLTLGKVAGKPISCLSHTRAEDMTVIDDRTIAFREGGSRVYVNNMRAECTNLDNGRNVLVTRSPMSQICRGDIAQVIDSLNHFPVGSCVFGDFVPYTTASR